MKKVFLPLLFTVTVPVALTTLARAETPSEWVKLARRVHGGSGSYLVVGIRIGLDARQRLHAGPRDLDVTYYDGPNTPCPCAADGLMLATGATPGQGSLRIALLKSQAGTFGVAVIKLKQTGQTLRYEIPATARALLDDWNRNRDGQGRYAAVMAAPQSTMFRVQSLTAKATGASKPQLPTVPNKSHFKETAP